MRRVLLSLALLILALPVAGQVIVNGVAVSGGGGVLVNGVSTSAPCTLLSDGSLICGHARYTPLCTLDGVSIQSVGATTTTLAKTAHGCSVWQGDIVAVEVASIASNVGAYLYTGTETFQPNTLELLGLLTAPETNMRVVIYRGVGTLSEGGNIAASAVIDEVKESALRLGYRMDMTTGESSGLNIFMGTPYTGVGFGTEGETGHQVIRVYRYNHQSVPIFSVDARGDVDARGNVTASGGVLSGANLTAAKVTAGAAPTVIASPTTGSTRWDYSYVPIACDGTHGLASATTTIADGYATLSANHINVVTVPAQTSGVCWVDMRREFSGGTPATLGVVGRIIASPAASTVYYDDGDVGDASATPTTNTTGTVTATVGRIGAATTSTDSALEVVSSVYPAARITRTATDTNTINNALQVVKKTTGNMTTAFGAQIEFAIQDDTAGPNGIATISGARSTTDTTGYMVLGTSGTDRVRISPTGGVGIGYVAADATSFLEVDASSSYTTFVRLRDSGVGHGMTGILPTVNFGAFDEVTDNSGGLLVRGLTEDVADVAPVLIRGISGNASPTAAMLTLRGEKKSGTGSGAIAVGEKVLEIDNYGTNPVTIYGSGALTATGAVTGASFTAGVAAGITTVITVRDSGGAADCTITVTGGIITATTCSHT
ncbi:MAG: hypothetical protein HY825_13635 [Acidobacteria bacterium]|nr:hypothetical protein [Acidobacteriota bacterium]